jgi:hypothetical protein
MVTYYRRVEVIVAGVIGKLPVVILLVLKPVPTVTLRVRVGANA